MCAAGTIGEHLRAAWQERRLHPARQAGRSNGSARGCTCGQGYFYSTREDRGLVGCLNSGSSGLGCIKGDVCNNKLRSFRSIFLARSTRVCILGIPSGNHRTCLFRAPRGRETKHRRNEEASRIDDTRVDRSNLKICSVSYHCALRFGGCFLNVNVIEIDKLHTNMSMFVKRFMGFCRNSGRSQCRRSNCRKSV